MNKEQIIKSIENHSDQALKDMFNMINNNPTMKEKNKEFLEMLEKEIQARKDKINSIILP